MKTLTYSSFSSYHAALTKLKAAGYIHANECWQTSSMKDRSMIFSTTHAGILYIDICVPESALSVL